MKNALILHGTNGTPQHNWFPWLQQELEARNYRVWVPELPGADKPNIERYNAFIFPQWTFNDESVLVGHSSGAVALLGILRALPKSTVISRAILVAGFVDNLGREDLDELFIEPFSWKQIRQKVRDIILFHSDNDPYVPIPHGEKLRDYLGANLILMKGQGHFNASSDPKYRTFPALLEKILA